MGVPLTQADGLGSVISPLRGSEGTTHFDGRLAGNWLLPDARNEIAPLVL